MLGRSVFAPPFELRRRLPRLIVGLVALGAGVALMVRSRLGLSPWEVLHQGLSVRTGIAMGAMSILVGVPVLLAWIPLRQRLGLGTVLNVVLVGVTIDVALPRLPEARGLEAQAGFLVVGILLMGLGAGLYIGAGLGAGPRDGLMTGLAARGHSIRLVRTLMELTVLAAGWALGGTVGIGTIVFALTIGPLVQSSLGRFQVVTLTAPAE